MLKKSQKSVYTQRQSLSLIAFQHTPTIFSHFFFLVVVVRLVATVKREREREKEVEDTV